MPVGYFTLNPSSYNVSSDGNPQNADVGIGGYDLDFSGPAGTTVDNFVSYCSNFLDGINDAPPSVFFYSTPSLTPDSTTNPGLAAGNYGELAYLYNTYGLYVNPTANVNSPIGSPTNNGFSNTINSGGLQLAEWALEYNQSVASVTSPNTPFQLGQLTGAPTTTLTGTALTNWQDIQASANEYLAAAAANGPEDVYFLNASNFPGNTFGYQGMLSTDLMNFTDTVSSTSSVTTAIYNASTNQPVSGTQALGTSVYDTATVSGSPATPTGTVTYYFYDTASPVYGTTTPVGTPQTVTLSGGIVPPSAATGDLPVGSYSFIGVYSGDTNYASSTRKNPGPLSINQSTTRVSTTIYNSNGSTPTDALGEQVYDTTTVSGTPFTPTGTVTYYFYDTASPVYGTTTPASSQTTAAVTLSGRTVPNSSLSPTLTEGGYAFIGVYSGDTEYAKFDGRSRAALDQPVDVEREHDDL